MTGPILDLASQSNNKTLLFKNVGHLRVMLKHCDLKDVRPFLTQTIYQTMVHDPNWHKPFKSSLRTAVVPFVLFRFVTVPMVGVRPRPTSFALLLSFPWMLMLLFFVLFVLPMTAFSVYLNRSIPFIYLLYSRPMSLPLSLLSGLLTDQQLIVLLGVLALSVGLGKQQLPLLLLSLK